MIRDGEEATGSMGNDAPLAALSDWPQLMYGYFKQIFAQVTNPPLDAIREAVITATDTFLGSEQNLLLDKSKVPVKHPLIEEIFSGKNGSSYLKISN